jgi:ATP-dependent exoDNAse (exonuclease V) beta subunit
MPSDTVNSPEFLIYRSSAGSGKTQALAGEYLRLILSQRADFRNVLAITFTNKAAEEMKERVLLLLERFSRPEGLTGYHRELFEKLAADAGTSHEEMHLRAYAIRRDILHHYSDFHLGTIDSFVHRIIRSFALELNLSFAFEVQLETQPFLQTTIDDLLAGAGKDPELTRSLVSFTRSLLEDEKSWNIDGALMEFSRFLTTEESIIPLEKLTQSGIDISRVIRTNREAMRKISGAWDHLLEQASRLEQNTPAAGSDFFYGETGGVAWFFTRCLRQNDYERIFTRAEKSKRILQCMEGDADMFSRSASAEMKVHIGELQEQLRDIWGDLTAAVDRQWSEYITRKLIDQNIALLSLSRKIREQMQVTMDRDNLIPIYEFNRLIWTIIRNQPVPFIYERTSERFDHFLIDEFQDTSAMQWFNLLPLVENSLSEGGVSMVVGDAKQAIYRWRNGDVWQFVRLPDLSAADEDPLLQARQEALRRYVKKRTLKHNYRSSREIINFNNRFFGWLKERYPAELEEIYRGHGQECGNTALRGNVQIHLIPDGAEDLVADLNRKMAGIITEKVQWYLSPEGGSFRPSDICILVRQHKEASILASALIASGLEVISGESFRLDTFTEAVLFKAITGLLLNRTDGVSAAVLATRLHQKGQVSHDGLHRFLGSLKTAARNHGTLLHRVNELLKEAGIPTTIERYMQLPIYEVCEQVIRDFFGKSATSAAVQYLLDLTAGYVRSSGNDLPGFNTFLSEKLATSIPLPETAFAIRIMTVHKAKGLEFPVVVYAFANEVPVSKKNRSKLLWIDGAERNHYHDLPVLLLPYAKELQQSPFCDVFDRETAALFQDMVNVIYVACTRPTQRLCIVSGTHKSMKNSERQLYDLLSAFLLEGDMFVTDDEVVWQYGDKDSGILPAGGDSTETIRRLPPWESHRWHNRLGIRTGHLRGIDESHRREAISRGNLIHRLLAETTDSGRLKPLLNEWVTTGIIPHQEADEIITLLDELLQTEGVRPFFDPSLPVKKEAVMITAEGQLLRPDRVVFFPDHIAVIDFKTGEPHKAHHKQVRTYCDTISAMGNSPVKGFLIYIDKKTVEEI